MLRNYLIVALRALLRHKLYSFVNLSGLAAGLTCFLLMVLYVQDELRFDRFHENAGRIYRVAMEQIGESQTVQNALSVAPIAPLLEKEYPEVERAVRVLPVEGSTILVRAGEKRFYESRVMCADAGFFEVFSFPLLSGDPHRALQKPYSIVLTREMAQKYFGDVDPVGKPLTLNNSELYTVTGVMKDLPENTHLRFDFLASFSTVSTTHPELMNNWDWNPFFTYVLLRRGASADLLNAKISNMVTLHAGDLYKQMQWEVRPYLQPLTAIHLHPLANENDEQGDMAHVYLFGAIAILILLIGCVNFTNLATARALTRVREVGLRKVIGATPFQLLRQFLGEAILQSYLALILAVTLAELLMPAFAALAGRHVALSSDDIPAVVMGLLGIGLVTGLVAGIYPAYVITASQPAQSVKGTLMPGGRGQMLRRALVVLQFAVAIFLIVGTVTAFHQLEYLRDKKLGFDKEQVLVVPLRDKSVVGRAPALKAELLKSPSILHVAMASRPLGTGAPGTSVIRLDQGSNPQAVSLKFFMVDDEYVKTMGMTLVAGRDFSRGYPTDAEDAVILNEQGVRALGWTSPQDAIGQRIQRLGSKTLTVIGVVHDFNFQPLRIGMQPMMLRMTPAACDYFLVRVAPNQFQGAIDTLRQTWDRFAPDWPFSFSFLDDDLQRLYRSEERFGEMFASFSILAIVIACLGLFGLVAANTERRRKEIGVRKVLGASVSGLVLLFSGELTFLVLVGNLIAWPLAYYTMSRWLENFAYHAALDPVWFLLAGVLVLGVALLTVAGQAVRAALANPVDALRYE